MPKFCCHSFTFLMFSFLSRGSDLNDVSTVILRSGIVITEFYLLSQQSTISVRLSGLEKLSSSIYGN